MISHKRAPLIRLPFDVKPVKAFFQAAIKRSTRVVELFLEDILKINYLGFPLHYNYYSYF